MAAMSIYIRCRRQAFATGKPAAKAAPLAVGSLAQPATPKGDMGKYMQ
jgi:hypothetical protein